MMRRLTRTDPEAGFTLMEIVIAVAILGAALFVLTQAHHNALRGHTQMRDEVFMQNLLERAMGIAETEVLEGNDSGKGDFGDRYEGYEYSFDTDLVNDSEFPGLYELTVEVAGPEETREIRIFTFTLGLT